MVGSATSSLAQNYWICIVSNAPALDPLAGFNFDFMPEVCRIEFYDP